MNDAAPGSPRRLSGRLAALAAEHPTGTLRIDDFMAAALYDPAAGYYTSAEDIGGPRRDFSTIPTLSPLLGLAIGRWVTSLPGLSPRRLDLIEVGAGGGHLAEAILNSLGWWARRRIRYRIVEISPRLRQVQQRQLAGRRVTWHNTVDEAMAASERPVVISNELADAFPCRLLQFEDGVWHERRLRWPPRADDSFLRHPPEDFAPAGFSALQPAHWVGQKIPEGQVVEVQPSYRHWLEQWVSAGGVRHHLTIDYGAAMPELYRDRPQGTLRGYFAHQRLTGGAVFQAPGKVDLTCDVNFSDLQQWGIEGGLETMAFTDQADFLGRWLPKKMTDDPTASLAAIMDPAGAGGAFKVLWQAGHR